MSYIKFERKEKWISAFVGILILIASVLGCSNGDMPEDLEISLNIQNRTIDIDPPVIKAKEGDSVTLLINADESGSVHLHGYNIEVNIDTSDIAKIAFDANATGSFALTFHPGSDPHSGEHNKHQHTGGHGNGNSLHGHAEIFESGTLDQGGKFSFVFGQDLSGKMVPFHNHMNHEMEGSVMVSDKAVLSSPVKIEIRETGFSPVQVTVKPDTSVEWINLGEKRARIASGLAPTMDGEHLEKHVDQEITLGSVEIYPR